MNKKRKNMNKDCPACGTKGEKVQELIGGRLLACMNTGCRVNEFVYE